MKRIIYSIGGIFYLIMVFAFYFAPILSSLLTIIPIGLYIFAGFYKYYKDIGKINIATILLFCFLILIPISALFISILLKLFI